MNNFYNPWNPYGMQSYQNMMQNQQNQNSTNSYPNMYQSPMQQNTYAFVNGIEGAKAYQVNPNQTMMLLDSENPIIYKKTSDQYGKSSIQFFKMIEVSEDEIKNINNPVPETLYASKEEVNELSKKIEDIYKVLKKKGE